MIKYFSLDHAPKSTYSGIFSFSNIKKSVFKDFKLPFVRTTLCIHILFNVLLLVFLCFWVLKLQYLTGKREVSGPIGFNVNMSNVSEFYCYSRGPCFLEYILYPRKTLVYENKTLIPSKNAAKLNIPFVSSVSISNPLPIQKYYKHIITFAFVILQVQISMSLIYLISFILYISKIFKPIVHLTVRWNVFSIYYFFIISLQLIVIALVIVYSKKDFFLSSKIGKFIFHLTEKKLFSPFIFDLLLFIVILTQTIFLVCMILSYNSQLLQFEIKHLITNPELIFGQTIEEIERNIHDLKNIFQIKVKSIDLLLPIFS